MRREDFEDVVEVTPAVMTLEALLEGGMESLPNKIRVALERDDFSSALKGANQNYSQKGPENREAALTYAILLVGRQLCDEALGVLRRALVHHAQDVGLQLAQAEALVVKGDFEAAMALLGAMREVSTAQPRHWSFIGDMYLDMGDDASAIDCYREAVERGSMSVDVVYRLGHLLGEREEWDGAAYYFGIAARLANDNAMLWQSAAEAYYDAEQLEEAVYAFERMLQEQPNDERAWLLLGLSHIQLQQYEEALEAFEEVTDLNPTQWVAWEQLGHVSSMLGRSEEALHAYRRALELNDDDLESLNGAMMAAYEMGDVEAAKRWGRRALELAPEHRGSRYNLGVILLSLRRGEEAWQTLLPLIEGEEQDEEERGKAYGALSVALMILGRKKEAFEANEKAQRLKVEVQWLAAFAEELVKAEGASEAMQYLDSVERSEPMWAVVRPMLGYLCSGLSEDRARATAYVVEFDAAIRREPQVVPVMWDFESWEAFAFRLERPFEEVFDTMLAILEGRQEIEDLKLFLPG